MARHPLPRIPAMVHLLARHPDIVDPRVLDALACIPRHRFVPPGLVAEAYGDHPIPIGFGQTVSQPYIVAWMTQWLEPDPNGRVLEIGTGSGYQTAILATLFREVFSIELEPDLSRGAADRLAALGIENVHLRTGDGSLGWPEAAPFDAILVTCAPTGLPQALLDQMADGGRLVLPLGPTHGPQRLFRHRRTRHGITCEPGPDVRFVPLRTGGPSSDT